MSIQDKVQGLISKAAELGVFFKAAPTDHVFVFRGSRLVTQGPGWSGLVLFVHTLVVVPISDQLVQFNFVALSLDRQRVRVQGAATLRYKPEALRTRRNFTINPVDGSYRTDDPRKFTAELAALLQEPIRGAVAKESLTNCLAGAEQIKNASIDSIKAMNAAFEQLGVDFVTLTIGDVKVEDSALLQALEAPFREGAQKIADQATAERRMAQAEHDRALALAKVTSEQEEAKAREELIKTEGANALAEAKNKADAITAELKGYEGADKQLVLAIAYDKMAQNPALTNLTISPDLLDSMNSRGKE